MKKYVNTFLALLLASTFIGCNSSNSTKTTEKTNATTPVVNEEENTPPSQTETETQKQIMPQCYIVEGTPKTESSVVVHVKCRNGNIHIDEATVTVDKKVKSVDYKGVGFNDYIGFKYLQPNTTYRAQLEVVVGGETITKSVKIRTREEKIEATPTPTPIVNHPPVWTKDKYYKTINMNDFGSKIKILEFDNMCRDKEGDKIYFSITSIDTSKFVSQGCMPIACEVPEKECEYQPLNNFWIEDNILFTSTDGLDLSCQYGDVFLIVNAKTKGGSSSAEIISSIPNPKEN